MLVPLAEIRVHHLHWRVIGSAASVYQLIWRVEIAAHYEHGVRNNHAEYTAGTNAPIQFPTNRNAILIAKVFDHMLAKNAIKNATRQR